MWRDSLDTKRFSEIAGSKSVKMSKQNMYHFKFECKSFEFIGLRCWAYYEPRAGGRFISKEQLYSCWPCGFPDLSKYAHVVTAGSPLVGPAQPTKLKLHFGKAHKKAECDLKREKAEAQVEAQKVAAQEAAMIEDSHRTFHRCFTCGRASSRINQRNTHALTCELPLTVDQQYDKAVRDHKGIPLTPFEAQTLHAQQTAKS